MPEKRSSKSKRRKIWELEGHWRCPIIGTCLAVSDLNHLARKLGIRFVKDAHDYNRHVHFAGAVGTRGPAAKLVHKLLDRRYRSTLNQFNNVDNPRALRDHWDEARIKGNIPGPLWAIATHPCTDEKVGSKVFADIHMLSHLVGASNRADIGRLAYLEGQYASLNERILVDKSRFREMLEEKKRTNVEMQKRLTLAERNTVLLKTYHRDLEKNGDAEDLRRMVSEQSRRMKDTYLQIDRQKSKLQKQNGEISSLRSLNESIQGECGDLRSQCAALEDQLSSLLVSAPCDNSACPAAGSEVDLNLCRKCIAFVGGRSRQTPHFRALVEKSDGEFLHHDGGVDESQGKLEAVLAKADLVFFPVDCISHGASNNIKRHCKRFNKPFIPLPTSSLSTFVTGLREATKPEPDFHPSTKM